MGLSVKRVTLDFSSGHDLEVVRWRPASGSTLRAEILSSSSPSLLSVCLSLSKKCLRTDSLGRIRIRMWLQGRLGGSVS